MKSHEGENNTRRLEFWYRYPKDKSDLKSILRNENEEDDFSNAQFLKEYTKSSGTLPEVRASDKTDEVIESALKVDNYIQELKNRIEPELNKCFSRFKTNIEELCSQ